MTSIEFDKKHLAKLNLKEGLAYLQGLQSEADMNRETPDRLKLSQVNLAPTVFQPRLRYEDSGADYHHVKELARAHRSLGVENDLGKLTVISIDDKWFLVDGHHRYEAYKRNKVTEPVAVDVYQGEVLGAAVAATRLNTRDQLPMTSKEKSERAWQLTVATYNSDTPRQSTMTVSQIVEATTIGERLAKYMRNVLKKLEELGQEPSGMKWETARWKASGEEIIESSDDWREEEAQKLSIRLGKLFGKRLARHPDVTLRALELYSPDLYKAMLDDLRGDFETGELPTSLLVDKLGRRLENDPDLKETTLETLSELEELGF